MSSGRVATAMAATTAAMIATPLARRGGAARRHLANAVVGGLATTTTLGAANRWGGRRALGAAALVGVGALAVERIGSTTGWPFGRYQYSGALQPAVVGVPVAVPAAWWAMALPAREVAHAALGWRSSPASRVGVGALALAAWDLFLDPQMTAEGYWRWERNGAYRGVPVSNYVGWVATGVVVMAALERLLPPQQQPDAVLLAEYAGMALLETVGFAAFFGDRLVAAVGALGMLPLTAVALASGPDSFLGGIRLAFRNRSRPETIPAQMVGRG